MVRIRYLTETVETLCFSSHKLAFISGPRQCGKTTWSKALLKTRGIGSYFNWDEKNFRKAWTKDPSAAVVAGIMPKLNDLVPIVVLDEIHKAKGWKRDLKGIFDTLEEPVDILVTGSAKLDVYRRGSDSLLGRYHHFRLHPFSLSELTNMPRSVSSEDLLSILFENSQSVISTKEDLDYLDALWHFGPFPEPLFKGEKRFLNLWQRERVERLVREDLRDISRIQELSQIEMLVSLLPERASGVLSINALREDLEVAYATMRSWLQYLKQVYYLFELKPYSQSIPRALKKEGKIYLWDWREVEEEGPRFENMIASHLLKYSHFLTDTGEASVDLCYLKNKEKQEIDFLLVKNKKPWIPIEVKLSQDTPSPHWNFYFKNLPCKKGLQIIKKPGVKKHVMVGSGEVLIISAEYILPLLV